MFTIKDNKVQIEPKMLFIPEFKRIWDLDKSIDKTKANAKFAFIYFMADYKSEYNIYGIGKQAKITLDIMKDDKYVPDEMVLTAIEKYEKLQETFSMRYLKNVRGTVDSLMQYYDELRYKSSTEQNVKDFDPGPVTRAMKEVETVIEKLEKWEKKVRSEEDDMIIRGGGDIGMFEDPENATWLKQKSK